MKNWTIILTCLVGVETLLIIIYLCGVMEVNANSPSVLISAFGVIITFVVAWQIWQTIASRDEIKDAKDAVKKSEELVKRIEHIEVQLKILPDTHSAYISVADGLSFLLNDRHFKAFHLFATGIIDSLKDMNDQGKCALRALVNLGNCMSFDENSPSMKEFQENWNGVAERLSEVEEALLSADQENKIFQALAKQHIDAFKNAAREKGLKI